MTLPEEPPKEFMDAVNDYERAICLMRDNQNADEGEEDEPYDSAIDRYDAKRAALLALFDRQREENEQLKDIAFHLDDDGGAAALQSLQVQNGQLFEKLLWANDERASLSSQLERQREEIERLRRLGIPEDLSEALGTTGHIVERLTSDALSIADQLDASERDCKALSAQLERLKAEQLTAEEAAYVEEVLALYAVPSRLRDQLINKLSRQSDQ